MLNICLATFVSFISYMPEFLSFISYAIVQLIHFIINFHLIYFIDHSPSHSHSPYLVILTQYHISTSLSLSFFIQSVLWKLGVSLDKVLIWNAYCIIWNWTDGITSPCYFIIITRYRKYISGLIIGKKPSTPIPISKHKEVRFSRKH